MHKLDALIQKEKDRVADGVLFICGIFVSLPIAASVLRYIEIGWLPAMSFQAFLFLSFWSIYIFRKDIPYTFRSGWLSAMFLIGGSIGVMQFGIIGNGMAWMILGPVLGTLFFNTRVGFALAAIGIITIASIGYFVVDNSLYPVFDLNQYLTSPKSWGDFIFSFSFISILLVFTLSMLNKGLISALETAALRNQEIEYLINERTQELEQANQKLSRIAQKDSLTGLLNRGTFVKFLEDEIAQSNRSLSLIFIDIDYFKKVNDTYGHPVGDQVLIFIAKIIDSVARKIDCVGRLGGEEFAIFLRNVDLDSALAIAERVRKQIEYTAFEYGAQRIFLTMSAGVAYIQPLESSESFINRADQAMYEAKNNGRNRVEFSSTNIDGIGD